MEADPDARLSVEEFSSLLELYKGLMARTIPAEHKARLIQIGYITERLGGLVPTHAGVLRLAKGR
jgi:hypothetical protein